MHWLLRPWPTSGAGAGGSKRGIGRAELFVPVSRPYFLSPPAEDCLCNHGVLSATHSLVLLATESKAKKPVAVAARGLRQRGYESRAGPPMTPGDAAKAEVRLTVP